jgi:hypothetical protein
VLCFALTIVATIIAIGPKVLESKDSQTTIPHKIDHFYTMYATLKYLFVSLILVVTK